MPEVGGPAAAACDPRPRSPAQVVQTSGPVGRAAPAAVGCARRGWTRGTGAGATSGGIPREPDRGEGSVVTLPGRAPSGLRHRDRPGRDS